MNINLDEIKESLQKTKDIISSDLDLNEAEEKEINIYIDQLVLNLQEKIKKIDIVKLSKSIETYIKENDNV
tara:strand:+ start:13531 stop:13743 length:213 start_codon:yes stop_codon:yes gene_type:complete